MQMSQRFGGHDFASWARVELLPGPSAYAITRVIAYGPLPVWALCVLVVLRPGHTELGSAGLAVLWAAFGASIVGFAVLWPWSRRRVKREAAAGYTTVLGETGDVPTVDHKTGLITRKPGDLAPTGLDKAALKARVRLYRSWYATGACKGAVDTDVATAGVESSWADGGTHERRVHIRIAPGRTSLIAWSAMALVGVINMALLGSESDLRSSSSWPAAAANVVLITVSGALMGNAIRAHRQRWGFGVAHGSLRMVRGRVDDEVMFSELETIAVVCRRSTNTQVLRHARLKLVATAPHDFAARHPGLGRFRCKQSDRVVWWEVPIRRRDLVVRELDAALRAASAPNYVGIQTRT